MENAADALKMAAAVLIFVLALSISINAFGEVRKTSKIILDYNDREYDYTYVEENGGTKRIVGLETIVPSIYKAYKENYKIVFIGVDLYEKKNSTTGQNEKIYSIDLEKDVIGNDKQKEKFIEALLYGKTGNLENWDEIYKTFADNGIYLKETGLYGTIKGMKFEESLGVYYQEEVQGDSGAPDANKTKKRVITYKKVD